MSLNYKNSGVDVEAGDRLVDWLQSGDEAGGRISSGSGRVGPHADKIVSGIGGFAAVFRMQFPEIKKPCLVSSTDGIGTKVKLASDFGAYRSVGQDLVAMCVNDLVCCGAQPLFFLDYYASGKLDLEAAREFLGGVREACHESGCALIGGETAEMPGLYRGKDFDAAGFSVGIVDEDEMLGPHRVHVGDQVIGVASSGFHSNGFSLLRKVFENDLEVWKDRLLIPTHLYANLVLALVKKNLVSAVANITGGGMENIPRVLPKGTELPLIDWAWPPEFCEVQDRTQMSREEMLKTLNCGVGLALVVKPENTLAVEAMIRDQGHKSMPLGRLRATADPGLEPSVVY